jgi:hypothetical protein
MQYGACGKFGVRVEIILDAIAETNLVPEHILGTIKNWRAADETLTRQCE